MQGPNVFLYPQYDTVAPQYIFAPQTSNEFALVRYNSDGTLDTDFGVLGRWVTQTNSGSNINEIIVQPTAKSWRSAHLSNTPAVIILATVISAAV